MTTKLPVSGWTLALTLCLVLCAAPASAITIQNGSDLWHTPGDGTTFADFTRQPIPADFFCPGSAPFSGRIVFQGVPLATQPPDVLGNTDTILHRLDDAAFDRNGVAVTRLQMRAMQFEGTELLSNACGSFRVGVVLQGEQPITELRIHRTGKESGFFEALIGVNVRIDFTPVDHKGLTVSLDRNLAFPPARNTWAASPGQGGVTRDGFVLVDTDADGVADTHVPATSRDFAPGWLNQGGDIVPYVPTQHGFSPIGLETATVPVEGNCETCHCVEDCGIHCPTVPTLPAY